MKRYMLGGNLMLIMAILLAHPTIVTANSGDSNVVLGDIIRGRQHFIVSDPQGIERVIIIHKSLNPAHRAGPPEFRVFRRHPRAVWISLALFDYKNYDHYFVVVNCQPSRGFDTLWYIPANGQPVRDFVPRGEL